MPDYGAEYAEKQIKQLMRKIRKVYASANRKAEKNLQEFIEQFAAEDEKRQKLLLEGKISADEYRAWAREQVFQGERWKERADQTARIYVSADVQAREMVNGGRFDVFAENANFFAWRMEKDTKAAVSFNLLDRHTVQNLIVNEPNLLPVQKRLNTQKDEAYIRKQITKRVTQGIILGEPIPDIAKRIQAVAKTTQHYSEMYARTAVTAAQNAGRTYMIEEARGMGIKVKRQWLATLDKRTRPEHAMLDGQNEDKEGFFHVKGYRIRFPGDPEASPYMVENCRCTLVYDLLDYPDEGATRIDNETKQRIENQTYEEWKNGKKNTLARGSGSKNNGEPSKGRKEEFLGKIDVNSQEAVNKTIDSFINDVDTCSNGISKDVENMLVITADGEVYRMTDNSPTSVKSGALFDKMKGSYNIHNHPKLTTQFTFSHDADIHSSVEDGTKVMEAFDDDFRYRFEVPESLTQEKWDKAYSDVVDRSNEIMVKYNIDFENYEKNINHVFILETCNLLGINYSRWNK